MTTDLDTLLERLPRVDGAELHLASDCRPAWRLDGALTELDDTEALSTSQLRSALRRIVDERDWHELERSGSLRCRTTQSALGPLRVLIFEQMDGLGAVVRALPAVVQTAAELGLPARVTDWTRHDHGLIVVASRRGGGKTSTVAALVEQINAARAHHIVIVQQPVETLHPSNQALVSHRQPGLDVASQSEAVRAAQHMDADVLVVDELSEPVATLEALRMAASGTLVIAAVPASDCRGALARLLRTIRPEARVLARHLLARSITGLTAQTLCRASSLQRVPAFEVLPRSPELVDSIVRENYDALAECFARSRDQGAQLLDDSLEALVEQGRVRLPEALRWARAPERFGLPRAFALGK